MLDSPRPRRYQSAVLLGPRLKPPLTLTGWKEQGWGAPILPPPVFVGWRLGKEVPLQSG
jgi:hypothetical protein